MLGLRQSFATRFFRRPDGYAYYPTPWSQGYLLKPEEYEALEAAHLKQFGFWSILKWILVLVFSVAIISTIATALDHPLEAFERYFEITIGAGIVGSTIWMYSAPYRHVRQRKPDLPKRGRTERLSDTAKNLPWPVYVFSFLILPWFGVLGWTLFKDGSWWGLVFVALMLWALFEWGQMAKMKWRNSREELR